MPPRPNRRNGDATRERLVQAAMELFTTAGFLETTTAAIAGRAEVAEGTIYRHFRSKDELFNETYRRAVRLGLEALAVPDGDRAAGAPERLAGLARRLLRLAAEDAASARMLLGTTGMAVLDEPSRTARRQFDEGLAQLVAMGKSDGLVRPGPAELWAQVWLAVVGYAVARVGTGEWAPDGALVSLTLDAAWAAIAGSGGSVRGLGGTTEDRQLPGSH